ncbi:MAG: porin [Bacteroidetes bacterium]|nr:porin [Bacteroidota bacterium]MBL7104305.1 porin [Bacteroidales bacterium]
MKNKNSIILILFLTLFFLPDLLFANDIETTEGEDNSTRKDSLPEWIYNVSDKVRFYGSYRINAGMSENGYTGVADNSSRFGLKGKIPLNPKKKYYVLARAEWGAQLVSRDEKIKFSPDPGAEYAQANNALFTRLGYVGFQTPYGNLTFGKQWSVYYMVSGITDMFLAFGGEASGTYNANTDGGVSGTGRPNNAMKYTGTYGPVNIGLQAQMRTLTGNDQAFADTYGTTIYFQSKSGFYIGTGFNKVLDGVDNPEPDEAKKGDQAAVAGICYKKNRLYLACTYSNFKNHEKFDLNDTTTIYYSGQGIELYARYIIPGNEKWHISTGFNYMKPYNDIEEAGKYDLLCFIIEAGYNFSKASYAFIATRIDYSKNIDGSKRSPTLFGGGVRFSFGY